MSRLEELPPDQRAALSLLLRQQKSYAEVAEMLQIPAEAVHDRAQAALALLAPAEARAVSAERRVEIGDYLLGQAAVGARLETAAYLSDSEPARNWALAVAGELAPLGAQLPEIPTPAPNDVPHDAQATPAPPGAPPPGEAKPPSRPSQPSSSLIGGALVVVAVVAVIVVAVLLLVSGSSKHNKATASNTTGTTSARGPSVHQLTLRSPTPGSRAAGVVEVLAEGNKRAFYVEARNLPPSHGFFYAVWLYNSPTSAEPLSKAPVVGSSGHLAGGALLPANAASFSRMLLTKETSTHPTTPGPVVLEGPFTLE